MPDLPYNTLRVQGKRPSVLGFYSRSRTLPEYYSLYDDKEASLYRFRFAGLVPMPEAIFRINKIYESRETIESVEWRSIWQGIDQTGLAIDLGDLGIIRRNDKPFFPPWYAWRCQNWNTPWEVTGYNITVEGTRDTFCLALEFDTDWRAPREWLRQASRMFPDLEFEFRHIDCCNEWCEVYVLRNGNCISWARSRCFDTEGGCPVTRVKMAPLHSAESLPQEIDVPEETVREEEDPAQLPMDEPAFDPIEDLLGEAPDNLRKYDEFLIILQEPSLETIQEPIPGESADEQQDVLIASWDVFLCRLRAHLHECLGQDHPHCSAYVASGREEQISMHVSDGCASLHLEKSIRQKIQEFRFAYGLLVKITSDR